MFYREIRPSPAAARLVRCYWILEDDGAGSGPQRIVPDGRPELILNLGRPYECQTPSGWNQQPQYFFMGQITGPLLLRAAGPARMIGIRFHPHTAGQVLGIPMSELTDTTTSLDDISRPLWREMEELADVRAPLDAIAALDRVIARRIFTHNEKLAAAVRGLQLVGGSVSIAAAADHAGLSVRQFERQFLSAVGIAPKLFCRMQRFQRVFPALEEARSGWADLAARCGYYDQAHLIRDFREFAGKPPAVLLATETDLARHFVQSRRMSHFSNTQRAEAC